MRFPKPFYRTAKQAWYLQLGRQQLSLGKDRAEAFQRYQQILLHHQGVPAPSAKRFTAAEVCDLFLEWSLRRHERQTYDWYRTFLQSFCDAYGGLTALDLKPFHVTQWLERHDWSSTSQNQAITCIKRALNWAVGEGLIANNPLQKVRKPRAQRRERILTANEWEIIFAAVKDDAFAYFLQALRETGCRPSEIRAVSKEQVDMKAGLWVFTRHKTHGKTGKPRVIYLTPAMIELTGKLLRLHPEGPIFRNTRGQPWTRNAIRIRFRNLRQKFPQLRGVTAYVTRHTYATDALERGVPIATVAELMGHESTRMIEQNYAHLAQKREHLRQAAIQATRPTGA